MSNTQLGRPFGEALKLHWRWFPLSSAFSLSFPRSQTDEWSHPEPSRSSVRLPAKYYYWGVSVTQSRIITPELCPYLWLTKQWDILKWPLFKHLCIQESIAYRYIKKIMHYWHEKNVQSSNCLYDYCIVSKLLNHIPYLPIVVMTWLRMSWGERR